MPKILGKTEELVSPTVRLAIAAKQSTTGGNDLNQQGQGEMNGALGPPSGRLAVAPSYGNNSPEQNCKNLNDSCPALLVSYFYLAGFEKNQEKYHYRDWVMDSGAFSAHNSGVPINLQDYIDCCKRKIATDPTLSEVFALDVIGSWEKSLENTEEMWRQGVPAIPCFHYGEPWDVLKRLADTYPKLALGGLVGQKVKPRDEWIGQCFARVWPKKIHGFGLSGKPTVMRYPFHSVDATNWEISACKYGQWKCFGNAHVSVRGSKQNLRAEVEWYLDLEREARARWKKEMAQLESIAPTVRLAVIGSGRESDAGLME